jgi:RNA polymerase sigma-70 factor (ECF subfamily)
MDVVTVSYAKRPSTEAAGLSEEAFVHLYQHELERVLNYVRLRLGPNEAEDVTADIFARVWAHRHDYDLRRGQPETWLWAIARNATRDYLRRRRPIPVAISPDIAGSPDPATEIGWQEEWARTEKALSALAAQDREIIALRFGAQMTNRAIAALLNMAEANVAQRLRRALRKMRAAMGGTR